MVPAEQKAQSNGKEEELSETYEELQEKIETIKKNYQPKIDALVARGQEIADGYDKPDAFGGAVGIDFKVDWKDIDFEFGIPSITVNEQRISFDVPEVTMVEQNWEFGIPAVLPKGYVSLSVAFESQRGESPISLRPAEKDYFSSSVYNYEAHRHSS